MEDYQAVAIIAATLQYSHPKPATQPPEEYQTLLIEKALALLNDSRKELLNYGWFRDQLERRLKTVKSLLRPGEERE